VDLIVHVEDYPKEDSDCVLATSAPYKARGGNAANSSVVASQFGINASLLCSLSSSHSDESNLSFALNDLRQYSVHVSKHCPRHFGCSLPVSHVVISKKNQSRTIIHHRALPELSCSDFENLIADISSRALNALHFEGRAVQVTKRMIEVARQHVNKNTKISLELEKAKRRGLLRVLRHVDIVFLSKDFVRECDFGSSASEGIRNVSKYIREQFETYVLPKVLVCTWGSDGASCLLMSSNEEKEDKLFSVDMYEEDGMGDVIETVGAGDTFIGAFLAHYVGSSSSCRGMISEEEEEDGKTKADLSASLRFANRVASYKVRQRGFRLVNRV
jgi:ketohexokinase